MSSREIILWIDERWDTALRESLKDETLEDHLQAVLDEMCGQLPQTEQDRINREIEQEHQQHMAEQEASRRFAIFHVTEGECSECILTEEALEFLQAASRLRNYLQVKEKEQLPCFIQTLSRSQPISEDQFDMYVMERRENTGRVTGAFNIDLNGGTFEALSIMDGWKCYSVKDVCTAAYHGYRAKYDAPDARWVKFLDYLQGKECTAHDLSATPERKMELTM